MNGRVYENDLLVGRKLHVTWFTWATRYTDGTLDAGHFMLGHDGLGMLLLCDQDGQVRRTTDVNGHVELDSSETWPVHIEVHAPGEDWEFLLTLRAAWSTSCRCPTRRPKAAGDGSATPASPLIGSPTERSHRHTVWCRVQACRLMTMADIAVFEARRGNLERWISAAMPDATSVALSPFTPVEFGLFERQLVHRAAMDWRRRNSYHRIGTPGAAARRRLVPELRPSTAVRRDGCTGRHGGTGPEGRVVHRRSRGHGRALFSHASRARRGRVRLPAGLPRPRPVLRGVPDQRRQMWLACLDVMAALHTLDTAHPSAARLADPHSNGRDAVLGMLDVIERQLTVGRHRAAGSREALRADARRHRNRRESRSAGAMPVREPHISRRRVVAALDWELAHVCPPEADVAYLLLIDEAVAELNDVPRLPGLPDAAETVAYYDPASARPVERPRLPPHAPSIRLAAMFVLTVRAQSPTAQLPVRLPHQQHPNPSARRVARYKHLTTRRSPMSESCSPRRRILVPPNGGQLRRSDDDRPQLDRKGLRRGLRQVRRGHGGRRNRQVHQPRRDGRLRRGGNTRPGVECACLPRASQRLDDTTVGPVTWEIVKPPTTNRIAWPVMNSTSSLMSRSKATFSRSSVRQGFAVIAGSPATTRSATFSPVSHEVW